MNILYLYSEIIGYQLPVFKEYVNRYNAIVYVIHWDKKKLSSYMLESTKNVFFLKRSQYNYSSIVKLAEEKNIDIVYVSGWMDFEYLKAIRKLKKMGIPIITGFDDIWWNSLKQVIASLFFHYIKKMFFTHAWVAGPYQFEYAKRLKFKNDEIIFNCLSADLELFNKVYDASIQRKQVQFPHRFLYVGRFELEKGVDILVNAWNSLKDRRKDWTLTLIGNGSLKDLYDSVDGVEVIPFLQPNELTVLLDKYGCFILPSRREQWGVVLHEFAAAGFPIISSNVCGANPVFVKHNYNGYIYKSEDINSLTDALVYMIDKSDVDLFEMSVRSHSLGQMISPEITASSFLSVLKK